MEPGGRNYSFEQDRLRTEWLWRNSIGKVPWCLGRERMEMNQQCALAASVVKGVLGCLNRNQLLSGKNNYSPLFGTQCFGAASKQLYYERIICLVNCTFNLV